MKLATLFSGLLLPTISLAYTPSPLRAVDGRDLSFLLKRYDGPIPILRRATKGRRHIIPRTLQVEEVPIRRALTGLVERQQCVDPGYVPCADGTQCCPAGATCEPGACCPAGNMSCPGECCPDLDGDCCPAIGCCPSGQSCFAAVTGEIGCCPRGQTCTTISGCADATYVECPGETFCCPPSTTCSRANGVATCVNSSGSTITVSVNVPINTNGNAHTGLSTQRPTSSTRTATSSQNTNQSNNNNSNQNNSNSNNLPASGALPQVAGASGLMVTIALLGTFLL